MTALPDAYRAIDQVARASCRRLVAFLAARSRDVAAAEDALADAFQAALLAWPTQGVPERPEAWLLTAARRRLIDSARHAQVVAAALPTLAAVADEALVLAEGAAPFPDERLKLMFVCAHPAIDRAVHTPLMLQTVLGLDAVRIARAFALKPAAMGQRLSRAKAKIRDAAIPYHTPQASELPARLDAVLQAIYAAYTAGWDAPAGPEGAALTAQAIELGGLLDRLLPDQGEVLGLCALMLFSQARSGERRSAGGAYVPLAEQDARRWSAPMMAQAAALLSRAAQCGGYGRFQLEAAIQSVHARRGHGGETDWPAIALLYEGLLSVAPTLGARLGHIAALAQVQGAEAAWALLARLPADSCADMQAYWALKAELLTGRGQRQAAQAAYAQAIALAPDPACQAYLRARAERA